MAVTRLILLSPLFALVLACGEPPTLPSALVRVGNAEFVVEIARQPPDRHRGLSGRASLAPNGGMLFSYDDAGERTFTMRGMAFDLDLIWIRDAVIVGVTPDASPAVRTQTYPSPAAVDMVLEVAAGTAATQGWVVGTSVRVTDAVEMHAK